LMAEVVTACVFRLLHFGLVIVEDEPQDGRCSVYRPVGVGGTPFHGWEEGVNVGQDGTYIRISAPPAILSQVVKGDRKRWLVDISAAAAPGPGPVWYHEEFASVEEAITAIQECFFGGRVDFNSESLGHWRSDFA
jgi:hypothetical protein